MDNLMAVTGNLGLSTTKIEQTNPQDLKALEEACKEFEAIFINMMLKQMRATVVQSGMTERSSAREIYESMHDEALSEEIAKGNGIGLAKQLYQQLLSQVQRPNIKAAE